MFRLLGWMRRDSCCPPGSLEHKKIVEIEYPVERFRTVLAFHFEFLDLVEYLFFEEVLLYKRTAASFRPLQVEDDFRREQGEHL